MTPATLPSVKSDTRAAGSRRVSVPPTWAVTPEADEMSKSTKSNRANKSPKPYPEFPLTPHTATNRWCKKHKGKSYYFGKLDDWQGALERFNREWPFVISGREIPPEAGDGCRLADLSNEFLNAKRARLECGELSPRSFRAYFETCAALTAFFGNDRRVDDLRPNDFERYRKALAAKYGVVGLRNEINRVRVVFKFAHDNRLIDRSVSYGQSFNRPSAKTLRIARNEAGPRMFEAHEIGTILAALDGKPIKVKGEKKSVKRKPDPVLKAAVLLALNGGFGNTDIASLPQSAVAGCWLNFPRPKTGINRRIPLWDESLDALRKAIAIRPVAADPADDGLCFLTSHGNPWVRVRVTIKEDGTEKHVPLDALGQRFVTLLKVLKINGRRGLGFYTLRHVFETIAGESRDQVAVSAIMGHVDSSMGAVYRERISDERLRAVVDTVRGWLWPEKDVKESADAATPE